MTIACVSLFLYFKFSGNGLKITSNQLKKYILIGISIGLHWYFFFESIEISNVSIGLIGLSSSTLFTAFIEPLFFKRKIAVYEIWLGLIIIIGIYLIFNFQPQFIKGLIYSLLAAFFGSIFTVVNGKLTRSNHHSGVMAFYEFIGGLFFISILAALTGNIQSNFFDISINDIVYLLILGTVCTALAFVWSIHVMKEISPFTLIMAVNLEPVYGIIIAYFMFDEGKDLTLGFYGGTAIILGAVFSNGYLKMKSNQIKTKL
jgi:drug/metabolite transporter (DMT)-like permease